MREKSCDRSRNLFERSWKRGAKTIKKRVQKLIMIKFARKSIEKPMKKDGENVKKVEFATHFGKKLGTRWVLGLEAMSRE